MGSEKSRAESQYYNEKECCILCGSLTEVIKDQPLSEREYYIEGAGQLCRECYQKLYVPRHNEDLVHLANRYVSDNWFL